MHINKLYSVYSNLDYYTGLNRTSLVVNRIEPGLHCKLDSDLRKQANVSQLLSVWKDEYVVFPAKIARLHWDGSRLPDYRRY